MTIKERIDKINDELMDITKNDDAGFLLIAADNDQMYVRAQGKTVRLLAEVLIRSEELRGIVEDAVECAKMPIGEWANKILARQANAVGDQQV